MHSLSGALGQVFVFLTIAKYGALNCAVIGLGRKMLTLLTSFVLFNHALNGYQVVGLSMSVTAMVAMFFENTTKKDEVKSKRHYWLYCTTNHCPVLISGYRAMQ